MCGIAGLILQAANPMAGSHLKKMTDSISHRGPDAEGHWSNEENTVPVGHRRLSIIDLSHHASQPMSYASRYRIVHNGEIYNYIEIRSYLQNKGYRFTTATDTEVIAAAYDFWKEKCLQQFDGMFAFAIWDEKERQLFAARDRFGEKPFYYYEDEGHFIFASEMKALWAIGIEKKTDDKMLLNYLTLGHVQNCVDKEQTFFQEIYALPPAHYLTLKPALKQISKITRYWSINKEIKIEISAAEAIDKFTELLTGSVKRRLRTDVSLGASLSGGLDSSTIVALVNQISSKQET
jgi:asparagine synthase (glutamine-hydrolysing)